MGRRILLTAADIVKGVRVATSSLPKPAATSGRRTTSRWLIFVAAVVMVAGLLFGYDQGVIGGALQGIEKSFKISTTVVEIITSWVTLGALVGAFIAGVLADRLGRRWTVILAAVLFTAGAVIE